MGRSLRLVPFGVLVLSQVVVVPPARAAQPPAQETSTANPASKGSKDDGPGPAGDEKASAERLLKSRGLSRSGLVYVLPKEDEAGRLAAAMDLKLAEAEDALARMRQLEASGADTRAAVAGLEQQAQSLYATLQTLVSLPVVGTNPRPPGGGPAPDPAQKARERQARINQIEAEIGSLSASAGQLRGALVQMIVEYNRLGSVAAGRRAEIRRDQAALDALVAEVRARYDELAGDPAVRAALFTLGRGSGRRYTLGPRETYQANVKKLAALELSSKGYQSRKGGLILGEDANLKDVVSLARSFRWELGLALGRLQHHQKAAESRRKSLEADLAKERRLADARDSAPTAAEAVGLSSRIKTVRAEVKRLRDQDAEAEAERKALARDVASKREGFLQSVEVLRKATAASRQKHDEVDTDGDVIDSIDALKGKLHGPARAAHRPKHAKAPRTFLEEAEDLIKTEEVAIEPDKAAVWVAATVNGAPVKKMIVDPGAETVRLSERVAASVGVKPSEGVPVEVPGADGRVLRARRVTLNSVQVGKAQAVGRVDCLVMLDGQDAPAVLGESFLGHFVARIDADAGKLTLTHVNVPAVAPKETARTNGPGAGKDRPRVTAPDGR